MPEAYLLLNVSSKREFPPWAVAVVWTYIFVMMIRAARGQERRRKLENKPHTFAERTGHSPEKGCLYADLNCTSCLPHYR